MRHFRLRSLNRYSAFQTLKDALNYQKEGLSIGQLEINGKMSVLHGDQDSPCLELRLQLFEVQSHSYWLIQTEQLPGAGWTYCIWLGARFFGYEAFSYKAAMAR